MIPDTKDSALVLLRKEQSKEERFLAYITPDHKIFAGRWRLPGGKLKPGEGIHVLDREMKEEFKIGVEGVRVELEKPNVLGGMVYLCSATAIGEPIKANKDVGEPEWRTALQLADSDMPPNCKILLYTYLNNKGEEYLSNDIIFLLGEDKDLMDIMELESSELFSGFIEKFNSVSDSYS